MPPFIASEILEDVRARSDIVAVIESFIPLRRQGNTFKALCPFHKEKTPSFTVNPQRQIFHCFGCGKGGDVFRFVMEYEKLDFVSAVQLLARRAGVQLEETTGAGRPSQREKLFEINRAAAEFFQWHLRENAAAAPARDYLAGRALPEKAIADFMLGYAPDQWDAFLNWARRKKYPPDLLEQAGLVVQAAERAGRAEPRWYDRFRDRLMFPIRDEQGRVVGFSGRVLKGTDQGAKYVNTPETPVFHKGRILYGLDRARRAIADAGHAVVCEGQIDVIQCHLAGLENAVAVQGTAFTDEHARILLRCTDNVTLVFDSDRAGRAAALRTGEVFLRAGLVVRVATLPPGDDPDTILRRADGADALRRLLEQAQSLVAFQATCLRDAGPGRNPEAAALSASRAILTLIRHSPSAVQQSLLIKEAAAILGIPMDVLQHELHTMPTAGRREDAEPAPARDMPADQAPPRELALIEHLAAEPALAELAQKYLPLEMITHPFCRRMTELIIDAAATGNTLNAMLSQKAADDEAFGRFAAAIQAAPPKIVSEFATNEESVKALILALRTAAAQRRRTELRAALAQLPSPGDGARAPDRQALEEEFAELGYDINARLKQWDSALAIM